LSGDREVKGSSDVILCAILSAETSGPSVGGTMRARPPARPPDQLARLPVTRFFKLGSSSLVHACATLMTTVNIHEAETHLSRLVDQAASEESFVIATAGRPMVQVTALDAPLLPKRLEFR